MRTIAITVSLFELRPIKHVTNTLSFRRLTVPRRPAWTAETTPAQLDHHERSAFLEWRRELAK